MAYKLPRLEMFASTRPIGTSSFGKRRSTVRPNCLRRCSIYSAYSLQHSKMIKETSIVTGNIGFSVSYDSHTFSVFPVHLSQDSTSGWGYDNCNQSTHFITHLALVLDQSMKCGHQSHHLHLSIYQICEYKPCIFFQICIPLKAPKFGIFFMVR